MSLSYFPPLVGASLEERYLAVKKRITQACVAAKRDPSEVKLVAVSKYSQPETIREVYTLGQKDFGESYAQELQKKTEKLADLRDLQWHFIGHLQTNKTKAVVSNKCIIHSVDKIELVSHLEKWASHHEVDVSVFVHVNIKGESQKHGINPSGLKALLETIESKKRLKLLGLMTLPPIDPELAKQAFTEMQELRVGYGGEKRLPHLSMGMSSDLESAILFGSTVVRVGSAIFGERKP